MNSNYSIGCIAKTSFLMLTLIGSANAANIPVSNTLQLQAALAAANPGDIITLSPGLYSGPFVATRSGAPGKPITVTGPATAIVKAVRKTGFLVQANYWKLSGFTITEVSRGVLLEGAKNNVLDKLTISKTRVNAIQMQARTVNGKTTFSTHNVVQNSRITDTGTVLEQGFFGKAITLGSQPWDWRYTSNSQPDASNNNCIYKNTIGPRVGGEGVELLDGTVGGLVAGNVYYADGIHNKYETDSFLVARGNKYMIYGNTVNNSATKTQQLRDGLQTDTRYNGYGNGNTFQKNVVDLHSTGYGVNISAATKDNVVCSDNVATNALSGLTNVKTTQCAVITMPTCANVLNLPLSAN
jgi:hypothetical protein